MIAARVAFLVLILIALVPEYYRYAAERLLYRTSSVVRAAVFARPREATSKTAVLVEAASTARDAARALPGDWRPLTIAGGALLLAGRPDQAIETYRAALALGERPEIVLNMGRAYASSGRIDSARAAYLRAAWISPPVLTGLSKATQDALRPDLEALERQHARGELGAPPTLPP